MLKERKIEQLEWSEKFKSVGGYLLGIQRKKFKDGLALYYLVKRSDDTRVVFAGTTQINLCLSPTDVGKFIQLTYLGEDTTREVRDGMNRPKLFKVEVDDERSMAPPADDPDGITDEDIPF